MQGITARSNTELAAFERSTPGRAARAFLESRFGEEMWQLVGFVVEAGIQRALYFNILDEPKMLVIEPRGIGWIVYVDLEMSNCGE